MLIASNPDESSGIRRSSDFIFKMFIILFSQEYPDSGNPGTLMGEGLKVVKKILKA